MAWNRRFFGPWAGTVFWRALCVILSVKIMELAYIIDQLIALDTAAGYFDLHNCYKVVRVHHEGTKCSVEFAKLEGEWVKPTEPAYLTLVFEQVTFLQLSEGLQLPIGLENIGFKEPAESRAYASKLDECLCGLWCRLTTSYSHQVFELNVPSPSKNEVQVF
jgi:hypothetical protein